MPRRPAFGPVVVAFLPFIFAGLLRVADASPASAVAEGALPNGVRYFVLPHASPKNDLSVRLVVHAGSLDENDRERGFAHFVEHMGFDGTRSHPPGSVRDFCQKLGLAWGADLNARTSYTHTVYQLDLPAGRAAELGAALSVLRDFADGMIFAPEQVAREAPVVVSELRWRDTVSHRTDLRMGDLLYAGTRAPDREVGGMPEHLVRATPAQLRAFYERNYLPDRITVVVVGPVETAAVVEKITTAFVSMPAPAAEIGPAPAPLPPAPAGVVADLLVVPTSTAVAVYLVSIQPRPPDDGAGSRAELVQRVAISALNTRLGVSLAENLTPFGAGRAETAAGISAKLVQHRIEIQSSFDRWAEAVGFAEAELRRVREQGFLQPEIDEAVAARVSAARDDIPKFASESSAQVSDRIENTLFADCRWRSPETSRQETENALTGLAAAEVSAALRAMFPEKSLHLIVRTPQAVPSGAPSLLAVYESSAQRRVARAVASAPTLHFYYEYFGPPGTVTSRDRHDALAVERVTFANGVRLNLRPSKLEPERFRLLVNFAQYPADVPKNRGGMAELAAAVFTTAHTGKHLENEIKRLLELHDVAREFTAAGGAGRCAFSGPSAELPFTLRLLTALLSDLKPDRVVFGNDLSRYNGYRAAQMNDVTRRAMVESVYHFADNDARLLLPETDVVADYPLEDVIHWMDTYWLKGPLEIGLVGDFAPDPTIAQAAASVGTLPPRITPRAPKPLTRDSRASRHKVTAHTPGGSATSCVLWPIVSADEPRANAALGLASDVLRDRLRVILREELGATYAPGAGVRRDRVQRDFGFAWMMNTFKPDQAERFTKQALEIAARLAKDGATAEEFARLREPARTRCAEDLRNNGWWLNAVVAPAQSHPAALAMARTHEKVFDEVTLDDVNRAARVFAGPATVTIVRPDDAK